MRLRPDDGTLSATGPAAPHRDGALQRLGATVPAPWRVGAGHDGAPGGGKPASVFAGVESFVPVDFVVVRGARTGISVI